MAGNWPLVFGMMRAMSSLRGSVAVVTGASRGVGKGIALSERGAGLNDGWDGLRRRKREVNRQRGTRLFQL
jgi:NAD(P)-dependent dehydrogenase (short-subunit alcohol dehydrogenase family)